MKKYILPIISILVVGMMNVGYANNQIIVQQDDWVVAKRGEENNNDYLIFFANTKYNTIVGYHTASRNLSEKVVIFQFYNLDEKFNNGYMFFNRYVVENYCEKNPYNSVKYYGSCYKFSRDAYGRLKAVAYIKFNIIKNNIFAFNQYGLIKDDKKMQINIPHKIFMTWYDHVNFIVKIG